MRVLKFSTNFAQIFPILRRIQRDIIKNVHRRTRKVLVIVRCEWRFNCLNILSKNNGIYIFIKIRPVGAELTHTDRWTDRNVDGEANKHDEANICCSKFCKRA